MSLGYTWFAQRMVGTWNTRDFTPGVQRDLRRDLVIMASVGAPAAKLTLIPPYAGLRFTADKGAELDRDTLDAGKANMVRIIRAFADHGMPVVVAFLVNDYFLRGPNGWIPRNEPNWYEYAYESMGFPEGARRMAQDYALWENEYIEAFADARVDRHILYYNLFTEAHYTFSPYAKDVASQVVRVLLEQVVVPDAKRSMDAYPNTSAGWLAQDVAAVGRPLAFTEVHAYPEVEEIDIRDAFAHVRPLFPDAALLLGEVGASYCLAGEDENAEARTLMDALDAARDGGSEMAFQWGLWDFDGETVCGDGRDGMRFGAGFSPSSPRAAWGRIVDRYSALPGGDFETSTGGWTGRSWDGAARELSHSGGAGDRGATGRHYLRLETTEGGRHEAVSLPFEVTAPFLAVSAFLRSNCDTVLLHVDYRDGRGWNRETGRAPLVREVVLPCASRFHQVQEVLGGETFTLPEGAREARLRFAVRAPGKAALRLDIDAVAFNCFTPLGYTERAVQAGDAQ